MLNPQDVIRALVSSRSRLPEALRSDKGAGLAEYALLLLLITVVVVGVVTTLGTTIQDAIQDAITALGG